MSVTMACVRCEASITTTDVAEALQWDVSHDQVCPVLRNHTRDDDCARCEGTCGHHPGPNHANGGPGA